jgi:hypothetical protein
VALAPTTVLVLAAALALCAAGPAGPVTAQAPTKVAGTRSAAVDSLLERAYREELAGRYGKAVDLLELGVTALQGQSGDPRLSARLLGAMGLTQSQAVAYDSFPRDSALATLERARRLADSTGEARGLAAALTGIGWVHYWTGLEDTTVSWDLPRRYFKAADSIHRLQGDSVGIAQGYFRLGLIHERKGQTDSMMALYRAGEALACGAATTWSYPIWCATSVAISRKWPSSTIPRWFISGSPWRCGRGRTSAPDRCLR